MLWGFCGSLQKAVKCYVITIERLRLAGLRLSMGAVEDNQFAPGSEVTRQEAQIMRPDKIHRLNVIRIPLDTCFHKSLYHRSDEISCNLTIYSFFSS